MSDRRRTEHLHLGAAEAGEGWSELPDRPPLPVVVRGEGDPFAILPGYTLRPRAYMESADVLSRRCRVTVVDWLSVDGRWTIERALGGLRSAIEHHLEPPISLAAHSFGGALALEFAARCPQLVNELIFFDTVGVSPRWSMPLKAVPNGAFVRMASFRAFRDFVDSCTTHPVQLARAGWWSFWSERMHAIHAVATSEIRSYVFWAERDTLLHRTDGQRFAWQLGAPFTVVADAQGGGPVDHDWPYRHPELLDAILDEHGLPDPRNRRSDRRPGHADRLQPEGGHGDGGDEADGFDDIDR